MYTLKQTPTLQRLTEIEVAAKNEPRGRVFQLYLTFVLKKSTDETEDITGQTFIDTEADVVSAINQNIARLNAQEELIAKVTAGTFTIEVPEPVVVPAKAEQLERVELEAKRVILREAKADVEIGLLTQAQFDAKVVEVKTPKVRAK